jgi:hypothetical protein
MESNNDLTPKEVLEWAKGNKVIGVGTYATPIKDYTLHDLKVADIKKEDEVFLTNDEVYKRIRRGNAIATVMMGKTIIHKYARKGIIKFFDYKKDFSNDKHGAIRTLLPIKKAFEDGHKLKVYLTDKANGENVQIAYEELNGTWIIGSKNVSIIVRDRNDITWYRTKPKPLDRFNYSVEFAELWFDLLEERITSKGLYDDFVNDIQGYTLCGENIGDLTHQHIKLYEKKDIMFFGMVNNQSNEICEPMDRVVSMLSKYGLTVVESNSSPVINTFEDFEQSMKEYYNVVLHQPIEKCAEGCVAYFSAITNDGEKIISLGKLKTFEYRFLRKLREKIKYAKKKKNLNVNNIIRTVEEECIQLLKEERDNVDLKEYLKFGTFILKVLLQIDGYKNSIQDVYAEFIAEVRRMYNKSGFNFNKLTENDFTGVMKILNADRLKTLNKMEVDEEEVGKGEEDENVDQAIAQCEEQYEAQKQMFNKFEKGNTYLLIVLGLVSSGKSTIIKYIHDTIESNKLPVNFSVVSSDGIQGKAIEEYCSSHPGTSHQEAFGKISHTCKKKFEDEVSRQIFRFKSIKDKVNMVFLDKNFPIEGVGALSRYVKDNVKLVAFYPKIYNPYESTKLSYPFSFAYFVQCYYRLKGRKNHETLDFDKNPHTHYILLSFVTLYKNAEFDLPGVDMYPLTMTDEDKDIKLPDDFVHKFDELMNGIADVKFNIPAMVEQFEITIAEVISYIEEYYPPEHFSDKRDLLYKEIHELLETKL